MYWDFFLATFYFKSRRERKNRKPKNSDYWEKKYFQGLKSDIFMFKIESDTQHFKGNYVSPFLAVNSCQPIASVILSAYGK